MLETIVLGVVAMRKVAPCSHDRIASVY